MAEPLVLVRDLVLTHPGLAEPVVQIPAWDLAPGAQVVLEGPSGSGKSTFLHALAGLRPLNGGTIIVDGISLGDLDEPARDRWRGSQVGLVFQTLNLLPGFTALENVRLGAAFGSGPTMDPVALLEAVGLGHRLHHRPGHLSLGEQQRVAIARAVIRRPRLLLADEPTGSLDPRTAEAVTDLVQHLATQAGSTLVMVCHQPIIAARFGQRIDIRDLNRAGRGACTS
jgi:putative ABC transport system ATP-binding protein